MASGLFKCITIPIPRGRSRICPLQDGIPVRRYVNAIIPTGIYRQRILLRSTFSQISSTTSRVLSIDFLRGIVIVIMALDHVRMYFGEGTWYSSPTDLATTTPWLFFTRWITHFCAPVFLFLAGISAFLYGTKKADVKKTSWYLFTRGLWLVFVEL